MSKERCGECQSNMCMERSGCFSLIRSAGIDGPACFPPRAKSTHKASLRNGDRAAAVALARVRMDEVFVANAGVCITLGARGRRLQKAAKIMQTRAVSIAIAGANSESRRRRGIRRCAGPETLASQLLTSGPCRRAIRLAGATARMGCHERRPLGPRPEIYTDHASLHARPDGGDNPGADQDIRVVSREDTGTGREHGTKVGD